MEPVKNRTKHNKGRTISSKLIMLQIVLMSLSIQTSQSQISELVNDTKKNQSEEQSQNQPQDESQNQKGTPVVFDTMQSIESMEPGSIVSKTFYYSNANDDPASTPTVGNEGDIKYIKISATGGNPSKMKDTVYKLDRWVKIPENAPKTITVEFKTKITKNKDFEWMTTTGSKEPNKRNKVIVDFMKEDGTSGAGKRVGPKELKTIDQWVDHSFELNIPSEAKYLHLGLETSGGYSLWMGNWTIK